ncbi:hypothetical protein N8865_02470, partial [Francisellaceae bacterium]|nr:hypothetical protein [Francisellaceae bacterium]
MKINKIKCFLVSVIAMVFLIFLLFVVFKIFRYDTNNKHANRYFIHTHYVKFANSEHNHPEDDIKLK